MFRRFLFVLIRIMPVFMLLTAGGCEQKTTTVEKSEQIHETEPQMVSPGEPVVE